MTVVYLIHFHQPLEHAQHYIGATTDLKKRLTRHASGSGSRLLDEVNKQGISWQVSRLWTPNKGTAFDLERFLKRQKNGRQLCPCCHHNPRTPQAELHEIPLTTVNIPLTSKDYA